MSLASTVARFLGLTAVRNTSLAVKAGVDFSLATPQQLTGSYFDVVIGPFAAADISTPLVQWISPGACRLVSGIYRAKTVAGQAGTAVIEKAPSGTAAGSGTVICSAADLTTTGNTNAALTPSAVTGAKDLAAGDALFLKLASGAATSLVGASIALRFQYI